MGKTHSHDDRYVVLTDTDERKEPFRQVTLRWRMDRHRRSKRADILSTWIEDIQFVFEPLASLGNLDVDIAVGRRVNALDHAGYERDVVELPFQPLHQSRSSAVSRALLCRVRTILRVSPSRDCWTSRSSSDQVDQVDPSRATVQMRRRVWR